MNLNLPRIESACIKSDASKLVIPKYLYSLKAHTKLPESDKSTWDSAYAEEYPGLHENAVDWEYISDKSF